MLLGLILSAALGQAPPTAIRPPAPAMADQRAAFLGHVNRARAQIGHPPLAWDDRLASIAARNNQLGGGHVYTGGTAQVWASSRTAWGAFTGFRSSPGHWAILMDPGARRLGAAAGERFGFTANVDAAIPRAGRWAEQADPPRFEAVRGQALRDGGYRPGNGGYDR